MKVNLSKSDTVTSNTSKLNQLGGNTVKATLRKSHTMTGRTLIPFLLLTFGLTWGIAALLIGFSDQITAILGEIDSSNPLIIIAVYAPGLSGVLLVSRHYGLSGLGSFFKISGKNMRDN